MASLTFDTLKDLVTKDHLDYKLAELKTKLIKWVLIRNANVFDSASGRLLPNQQIVTS